MAATATSARGRERRRKLIAAAGELLREHGFTGVSHRAVARLAEVSLAATTYYFDSLEELLGEAVRYLAERWLSAARAALADLPGELPGPAQLAAALRRVATPEGGDAVITMYERYLEAARHPHLRAMIADYDAKLDAMLVEVLRRGGVESSAATARLVLAVIDGAMLRALAEGRPVASVDPVLEQVVGILPRHR